MSVLACMAMASGSFNFVSLGDGRLQHFVGGFVVGLMLVWLLRWLWVRGFRRM